MLENVLKIVIKYIPLVLVIVVLVVFYRVTVALLKKFGKDRDRFGFRRQIVKMLIIAIGVVAVAVALPLKDATRGQLLSFLGILISATIALSATTFLGNLLAGLMLRAFRNFMAGDFLRVGEHFGRITECGILHTEIQTEESDLLTLPNLYVATQPVKVVRSFGGHHIRESFPGLRCTSGAHREGPN